MWFVKVKPNIQIKVAAFKDFGVGNALYIPTCDVEHVSIHNHFVVMYTKCHPHSFPNKITLMLSELC